MHSWCEYYDEVEQSWISLDPFLEDYKGVDIYHNSLKDHIKIITRGKSSVSPKLAFYSTNDFRASSTSDEVTPSLNFTAEILFEKVSTISKYIKGSIVINNTGNIPLTQFTILEENIPISEHIDLISNEAILLLLPGESISIPFNIPIEEIGSYNTEIPVSVSMEVSSESQFSKESEIISSLEVSTPLWLNLLSYSLVSLFFFVIVFLIYFVYRRFRK